MISKLSRFAQFCCLCSHLMAETDAPAAKRQRTEDSPITRADLWHDDGSVVLQAEGIQFRVNWSVLSMHSSFFRDMRGLPQPPDQPSIEGCPVIQLTDSSTDLKHLLNALYDPLVFKEKGLAFEFIAAVVRLGRKYDFKDLFAAAVERLTHENPTTLEAYDQLISIDGPDSFIYKPTQILAHSSLVFDTITLARENQLFAVLPCAYIRALLFNDQEQILDGISSSIRVGPPVKLPFMDQRVCILGLEKILKAQWQENWLFHSKAAGCTANSRCAARKLAILQSWVTHAVMILVPTGGGSLNVGLCNTCESQYMEAIAEGRKELWEKLPSFFDLPPWNELKNEL
ncbi:hypothetical protein B0H17DRAFT_1333540 [Mycena rosella]|uniref:BTB domain-containing protein n=1 Tax=Mycena rosella TaxID=1033263 RepID=A0AAD7D8H5_MYCRO|nr:hypothetical protein B0H17DRAFT_1333540 [Mycena rosella]